MRKNTLRRHSPAEEEKQVPICTLNTDTRRLSVEFLSSWHTSADLFGSHLMDHLHVDAQIGHTIGDLPTERAGGDPHVDFAVMAERVDVPVSTSTHVACVALWERDKGVLLATIHQAHT